MRSATVVAALALASSACAMVVYGQEGRVHAVTEGSRGAP
jgi:hypothetical protein